MTDNQNQKYVYYTKVAWAIYTLITIAPHRCISTICC